MFGARKPLLEMVSIATTRENEAELSVKKRIRLLQGLSNY